MSIFNWAKKKVNDIQKQREEDEIARLTSPGYAESKRVEKETYEKELSRLRIERAKKTGIEKAHNALKPRGSMFARTGNFLGGMVGTAGSLYNSYGKATRGIHYSAVSDEMLSNFGLGPRKKRR